MSSRARITQILGEPRKRILVILVATVCAATLAMFFVAQGYFVRTGAQAAANRMVLYQRALNEALRQHQHLPFILARDLRYRQALDPQMNGPVINADLRALAQEAKLEAVYIMDADGLVRAASNAGEPNSFLGQNYGFRPYFKEALEGARSDYFAIGATSGRPGYFVAEPILSPQGTERGVVAIKLDVSELQRSWEAGSEAVLAINKDNIVVLASDPAWLYRPTRDLAPDARAEIQDSRQFGAELLAPLDWTDLGDNRVSLGNARYLLASGPADWRDWSVYYLYPERAILRQTVLATAFFGGIIAILISFATFLRSRRIAVAYAASEQHRKELLSTNHQLEQAQAELDRTAQLAALGKLAAFVTHELGQPISAFRNHLAAAEMSHEITNPQTAKNLGKLVDRMDAITGQFKFFARARADARSRILLAHVLEESVKMLTPDFEAAGVAFHCEPVPKSLALWAVPIQLEQAFTNLLRNALHAVEHSGDPEIRIVLDLRADEVCIRISDNGTGLDGASLSKLQEPFFSTKPSGIGMGLGLAITTEIIRDHGGTLALEEADIGAVFLVTLPLMQEGSAP